MECDSNNPAGPLNPLALGERITILPVVHGIRPTASAVRKWLLEHPVDCLAVPFPPSFGPLIEQAITWLPTPSMCFPATLRGIVAFRFAGGMAILIWNGAKRV